MTKNRSPGLEKAVHRRGAIAAIGGGLATLLIACRRERAVAAPSSASGSVCTLTTEQEEGPFYVPLEKVRSSIADGQPGVPLAITLRVLDATTCKPLRDVAVDVWHCNAGGTYSDEPREGTAGESFLRGVQITDANGEVTFATVFPGWYRGRTVHVHVKALIGGASSSTYAGGHVCHTGDVFFPQETNDAMAQVAPYAGASTDARTRNSEDGVMTTQGGGSSVCAVRGTAKTGLVASISLAVDPRATPGPVGHGPPPARG